LGHGDGIYQPCPKRVIGIKRAKCVAAGENHTLVVISPSIPTFPFQNSTDTYLTSHVKNEMDSDENVSDDEVCNNHDSKYSISKDEFDIDNTCNSGNNSHTTILSLKEHCEREISKHISLRNALKLLSYSEAFDSKHLSNFCVSFILRYIIQFIFIYCLYDIYIFIFFSDYYYY
jgi:hypothetical protein